MQVENTTLERYGAKKQRKKNILLKVCTTESARNYDQKLSNRIDRGVERNALRSEKSLVGCIFSDVATMQQQIFEIP